ncbi:type II toxin-antitoxin system HicA family toxin [bacterium]|nr:type II toxin-antitoxin system HicA family toxin [bacterium]MBU1781801.1 type II toxin-antitoxin system HicA family toxin [bacterium]
MPKNLSTSDVAWILSQIGIALKRCSKEDVYSGEYQGRNCVVIVPRNKESIPKGTLSSIWRQAGITDKIADEIWRNR